MLRKQFKLEYQLKNASLGILWNSISSQVGLSEWFSDQVIIQDNEYTFVWEKFEQRAILIDSKPMKYVKFQWQDDLDSDYYFELKIVSTELSGQMALMVTDYADTDDLDDSILLWNKQIEVLKRKTGI
jgi:hypothetical protein